MALHLLLMLLVLTAGPACQFDVSGIAVEADAATEPCDPEIAGTGPFAAPSPIGGAFYPGDDPLIEEDDPSLTG
ncbi:MAG: hypothetical protein AAGC55_12100, partial [Myxococcota bacterium]